MAKPSKRKICRSHGTELNTNVCQRKIGEHPHLHYTSNFSWRQARSLRWRHAMGSVINKEEDVGWDSQARSTCNPFLEGLWCASWLGFQTSRTKTVNLCWRKFRTWFSSWVEAWIGASGFWASWAHTTIHFIYEWSPRCLLKIPLSTLCRNAISIQSLCFKNDSVCLCLCRELHSLKEKYLSIAVHFYLLELRTGHMKKVKQCDQVTCVYTNRRGIH